MTSTLRLALASAAFAVCLTASADEPPLAQTARLLAGKGVAPDSKLTAFTQAQFYTEYAEQLGSGWRHFQQPNLERIRAWWPSYAPAQYSTVLYPFSGPDIVNALAFFPDADTYLLFGLEAPGGLPNLEGLPEEAISGGLTGLRASLSTVFQVNYFITRNMEKKLGRDSFNSVTGLLLFFLAMSDCEVLGARRIVIGPDSLLAAGTPADDAINPRSPPKLHVPGVEITFKRSGHGHKPQTVRYFMVDIADASLSSNSPNFMPWLKSQGHFVTMIKSASYLMHKDGPRERVHFEQLRSLLLSQSDFLVQDDSGVPLRLFERDHWKLGFHGRYDGPTPEFSKYLQKDLRTELQRNSTGKLPFSYGYDYKPGESNLMTAERTQ